MMTNLKIIIHLVVVFFIVFIFPPMLMNFMGWPMGFAMLQMFGTIILLNIWSDHWEQVCEACGYIGKVKEFKLIKVHYIDEPSVPLCPKCGYYYDSRFAKFL